MFKRSHFQELIKRLIEPKRFIQVITGPRQIGKTTLVQQVIEEIKIPSIYISADGVANSGTNWLNQQCQSS